MRMRSRTLKLQMLEQVKDAAFGAGNACAAFHGRAVSKEGHFKRPVRQQADELQNTLPAEAGGG